MLCSTRLSIVLSHVAKCAKKVETFVPCYIPTATLASTSETKLDISGIYPPIPTPFNEDESIAFDKLEQNMHKWNKFPFRGYAVQGSNGEYKFLTPEERVTMVAQVRKLAGNKKLIMAGSDCESTRDTIAMSCMMADAGADAVLVVTPSYYKGAMTNEALTQHFTKVADASPVPVVLYSMPGNTGIDLAPEVILKLATHPNIAGLKDSGGNLAKLGNLVFQTSKLDFQILAGSAGFLLPGYSVGCVGGVCALANVLGQEVCQVEELAKAGKWEEAKLLQQRLIGPNACVTARFGIAGMKKALDWVGMYGGPTRSPLLGLTKAEENAMLQVFKTSKFM